MYDYLLQTRPTNTPAAEAGRRALHGLRGVLEAGHCDARTIEKQQPWTINGQPRWDRGFES